VQAANSTTPGQAEYSAAAPRLGRRCFGTPCAAAGAPSPTTHTTHTEAGVHFFESTLRPVRLGPDVGSAPHCVLLPPD
jgi:hypothetical protein